MEVGKVPLTELSVDSNPGVVPNHGGMNKEKVASVTTDMFALDIIARSLTAFDPNNEFLVPTSVNKTPTNFATAIRGIAAAGAALNTVIGASCSARIQWMNLHDIRSTVAAKIVSRGTVIARVQVPSQYFFGFEFSSTSSEGDQMTFVFSISFPVHEGVQGFAIHLYVLGCDTWRITAVFDPNMTPVVGNWRARMQVIRYDEDGKPVQHHFDHRNGAEFLNSVFDVNTRILKEVIETGAAPRSAQPGFGHSHRMIDAQRLTGASRTKLQRAAEMLGDCNRRIHGGIYIERK